MPRKNSTKLQERLAECEHAARLVTGLFAPGARVPDWLTDAVFDAIHAAASFKRISYFGDDDFDAEGLATLFLASRDLSLRSGPDALAHHIAAVLNNPDCPTDIYNALSEGVCDMMSAPVADSALTIALYLRAREAREAAKVA